MAESAPRLYHVPMAATTGARTWDGAWARRSPALALLLPCLLVLIAVCALNVCVNPLGLYWSHRFPPADVNYRAEKFALLQALPEKPSTLIIGSSRAMTMYPADVERYLPGECFNFAMPSARAEDYYAAIRLVCEDGRAPIRNVVLAVDYDAFAPGPGTMSEARYFPAFRKYLVHTPGIGTNWPERLSMLIARQQIEESLNVLRRTLEAKQQARYVELAPDGAAIQIAREESIRKGTFNLKKILGLRVRKYPARSLYLGSFTHPDPVRLQYLSDFLGYCRARGIQVYAYITPYHPALWRVLEPLKGIQVLGAAAEAARQRFEQYGYSLRDYSRVENFGGSPNRFYDEIHMMPINQEVLLDKLLRGAAAGRGDTKGKETRGL